MTWIEKHVWNWRNLAFFSMACLIWFWVYPFVFRALVPPSAYIDVRSIYIPDSEPGAIPPVIIDRHIRRTFTGQYDATVRVVDPLGGTFRNYCEGDREDLDLTAGSPYAGRDLDWWLGAPPPGRCHLDPGEYKLEIRLTIYAFFGMIPLEETYESAPFRVLDPLQREPRVWE